MAMVAERTYTLREVTHALGEGLKKLTPKERLATERQVDLVLQGAVDALKAMPELVWPRGQVGEYQGADGKMHPVVELAAVEYAMTEQGFDSAAGKFYYREPNGTKVYVDVDPLGR